MSTLLTKKLLALSLLSFSLFSTNNIHGRGITTDPVIPAKSAIAGVVAPLQIKSGDGIFTIHGKITQEYISARNPAFLNEALPDKYGYGQSTVDLSSKVEWGKEQFGTNAIEGLFKIRHRGKWGETGSTSLTDDQPVFMGLGALNGHKHASSKPFMWVKEAWIKTNLNAVLNEFRNDDRFDVKIGYFGYSLGRGIALGEGYGSGKFFLALYNKLNDFSAPGILFSVNTWDKKLKLEAYMAVLEGRSSDANKTMAFNKANQIGRESAPWAGTGNDDRLFATQVIFKPIQGPDTSLKLTGYGLYNDGRDTKVEFYADSKNQLFTFGTGLDFKKGNFTLEVESALNFGYENLAMLDRNTIKVEDQDNGNAISVFSKIKNLTTPTVIVPAPDGDDANDDEGEVANPLPSGFNTTTIVPSGNAIATLALVQELRKNRHADQNQFVVAGNTYQSTVDRIRPAYRNAYAGLMFVADLTYHPQKRNVRISGAYGYSSGDQNPHIIEADKTYKGFVGLHECYSGQRVKSIILLDARNIKRPLSFDSRVKTQEVGEDNSFSDLHYFGVGGTWLPQTYHTKKMSITGNVMGFVKAFPSAKIILDINGNPSVSPTDLARRFLGTEINAILAFSPLPNMNISITGGIFFPGDYYQDIKGARLRDDFTTGLERQGVNIADPDKFRIGTDTIFVGNMAVSYIF